MVTETQQFVRAMALDDLKTAGCKTVQVGGHTLALFMSDDTVYAVDNRCPHMGFPLHQGTVKDGILTCNWHYARFDLASGGTFDQWADDVRAFPVEVRNGEIWVDVTPQSDQRSYQRQRLQEGLQRNISLVIAKSVIRLLAGGDSPVEPFGIGLDFGVRYRQNGWGTGLTMHTALLNILPYLAADDRPRALYHGLSAVARDCAGQPARFIVRALPNQTTDLPTLKRWLRQFIEVRDDEGAERCIVSALRAGASRQQIADILFSAVTDHRFIDTGHTLDFTNKALEALDLTDWHDPEMVLTSLVRGYANADRAEESNSWRYPVDLVTVLDNAFAELPAALEAGQAKQAGWNGRDALVAVLLDENPQAVADKLLAALRDGCSPADLAGAVALAAAMRIARFHTSNEFGDWDSALHTFTFANAVHQGLRRTASPELVRGVFDAAMRVYLDRFLNVPAARLPEPGNPEANPQNLLADLPALLDKQQQVEAAGELVARYLFSKGDPDALLAMLGSLLLREDRDFHTIQVIEAAFHQYNLLRASSSGHDRASVMVLVAAARYLAAHAPTMRAQGQTYQIANRLSRGEKLFEE